jgi:hypothetical protein
MIRIISKKRLEKLELNERAFDRAADLLSQSDLIWLFNPILRYILGYDMGMIGTMDYIREQMAEREVWRRKDNDRLREENRRLREENEAFKKVIEVKSE